MPRNVCISDGEIIGGWYGGGRGWLVGIRLANPTAKVVIFQVRFFVETLEKTGIFCDE